MFNAVYFEYNFVFVFTKVILDFNTIPLNNSKAEKNAILFPRFLKWTTQELKIQLNGNKHNAPFLAMPEKTLLQA